MTNNSANTLNIYRATAPLTYSRTQVLATGTSPTRLASVDLNGDNHNDLIVANTGAASVSVFPWQSGTTFGAGATFTAVNNPSGLSLADVNDDGKVDLLTAGLYDNRFGVSLGNGNAGFAAPTFVTTAASGVGRVLLGDIDKDGKIDVVAGLSGQLGVFRGNGAGGFAQVGNVTLSEAVMPSRLASPAQTLVDITRDGNLDLIYLSSDAYRTAILPGQGNFSFAQPMPPRYPVGGSPRIIVSVDLDGDGNLDLVTANEGQQSVSWLRGAGDGTFTLQRTYAVNATNGVLHVAVGDLNLDGVPDLVVCDGTAANHSASTIEVFLGTGGGNMAAAKSYAATSYLENSEIADLNGDAFPDVVTASYDNSGVVNVFYGDGTGALASARAYAMGNAAWATTGDVNGDGYVDIATAIYGNSGAVATLLGSANGNFTAGPQSTNGANPWSLLLADFTADGNADVLTQLEGPINICFGQGSGSGAYAASLQRPYMSQDAPSQPADFDNDGKLDFADGDQVYFGNADGTFRYASSYGITDTTRLNVSSAVGDFNGDGLVDLAVGSASSGAVYIYLNTGCGAVAPLGTPAVAQSTLTISPNQQVADGTSPATVVVVARDAGGTALANVGVVLDANGGNNVFARRSGITDANGTFVTTLATNTVQLENVTATVGGQFVQAAAANFTLGPPNGAASTLTASPSSTSAGSNVNVTATVADALGRPLANQNVTFSSSVPSDVFTPVTVTSNGSGVAASTLRGTLAQARTLTATAGSANVTVQVTYVAASPNSTRSSLTSNTNAQVADYASTLTLTALVADAYGNPVGTQSVTLASSNASGNDVVSPASGSTTTGGTYTATLKSNRAELKTLTLTAGPATASTSVTFTAGSPNATRSTFTASPSPQVADNANLVSLSAVVRDAFGNPASTRSLTVTSSNTFGNDTLQPTGGTTDTSGAFAATLRSNKAETKTVSLVVAGTTLTVSPVFVAGSPNATKSRLTLSPTLVYFPGTSTASFQCRDAFNNPCSGQSVTFAADGNVSLDTTPKTTATNGQASVTLTCTDRSYNQSVITASTSGFSLQSTLALTLNDTLSFSGGSSVPLPAGTPLSGTLTALQADGTIDTNYVGTVAFSSTDAYADVPGNYTFNANDAGVHNFTVAARLRTVGASTLAVADQQFNNVVGSATVTAIDPLLAPKKLLPVATSSANCLEPMNLAADVNTILHVNGCAGLLSQIFYLGSDDTLRVHRMCVQAPDGGAAGQTVFLANCTGTAAQRWVQGAGGLQSTSAPTMCLDATSATASAGASLVACGSPNALSLGLADTTDYFTPFSGLYPPAAVVGGDNYTSVTRLLAAEYSTAPGLRWSQRGELRSYNGLCVGVPGGVALGGYLTLRVCDGDPSKVWRVDSNLLRPASNTNLCADTNSNATGYLQLATCSGVSSQSLHHHTTSGLFGLSSGMASSGNQMCVQASGTAANNRTFVAAACNPLGSQTFTYQSGSSTVNLLLPLWSSNIAPAYAADDGTSSLSAGATFYSASASGGGQQRRYLRRLSPGLKFAPVNAATLAFDISSGTLLAQTAANVDGMTFSLLPIGTGIQSMATSTLCLAVNDANGPYLAPITYASCSRASQQRFFLGYTSKSSVTTFTPISVGGQCLDVSSDPGSPNAIIVAPCNESASQLWSNLTTERTLRNKQGGCVGAGTPAAGAALQLLGCSAGADQNFRLTPQ